jgi:hypothetical protein
MKSRLRHLSLHAMLRSFGGDHSFAEQHLRALDRAFLNEIFVLHYQHFADVVRMIQENNVVPADLIVSNIAVFFGKVLKQQDRVRGPELPQREPQKIPLKAGWKPVLDSPSRAVFRHFVLWQIIPGRGSHLVSLLPIEQCRRESDVGARETSDLLCDLYGFLCGLRD